MLDNYGIRTDLALEATERFTEENCDGKWSKIHGTAAGNVYYD